MLAEKFSTKCTLSVATNNVHCYNGALNLQPSLYLLQKKEYFPLITRPLPQRGHVCFGPTPVSLVDGVLACLVRLVLAGCRFFLLLVDATLLSEVTYLRELSVFTVLTII